MLTGILGQKTKPKDMSEKTGEDEVKGRVWIIILYQR